MLKIPVDTRLGFYGIYWKTNDDDESPCRPSLHDGLFPVLHIVSGALRVRWIQQHLIKESDAKSGELKFFIRGPADNRYRGTLCKWDT